MRIGTWNIEGRRTSAQTSFLLELDCDVLLLTEVNDLLELPGYQLHRSAAEMAPKRRWAAVASRSPLTSQPDPHPASAMAVVDGMTFCSSILPWRGCGHRAPWIGARHADWTEACVNELVSGLPTEALVWGGDWNHALSEREWAGSIAGRRTILDAVEKLDLQVPTAALPHRIEGLLSIDHIALPADLPAAAAVAVIAETGGRRLSDHDAYVVEI